MCQVASPSLTRAPQRWSANQQQKGTLGSSYGTRARGQAPHDGGWVRWHPPHLFHREADAVLIETDTCSGHRPAFTCITHVPSCSLWVTECLDFHYGGCTMLLLAKKPAPVPLPQRSGVSPAGPSPSSEAPAAGRSCLSPVPSAPGAAAAFYSCCYHTTYICFYPFRHWLVTGYLVNDSLY